MTIKLCKCMLLGPYQELIGVNMCDELNIIMTVVYTHGTVSVSSLGSFSSVFFFNSKSSKSYLPLPIGSIHIEEYSKKKRGGGLKSINPKEEKSRREEGRKQMRVTVQAKLVVGFGGLIPMESGAEN